MYNQNIQIIMEYIKDDSYKFVLTGQSMEELNEQGRRYGFSFKKDAKYKTLTLYKIGRSDK